MRQLARQPGWQDVLTKLYVMDSYKFQPAGHSGASCPLDPSQGLLKRDDSMPEEARPDVLFSYGSRDDDDELSPSSPSSRQLKGFSFKSFDSMEPSSRSSSLSNIVDVPAGRRFEEEGSYNPLSPYGSSPLDLELNGMAGGAGSQRACGGTPETPSPLEHGHPFPSFTARKSSSMSNVLDDASYSNEPAHGDDISNTSNPQVLAKTVNAIMLENQREVG